MIHPTALIEDGARLGAGVEVGPFCHVGSRVVLEDGVRLLSHVVVKGVTRIGARTVVHPGAVLGGEGQIRGNDFAEGRLEIGADCVLRELVTMNCGSRRDKGVTRVGSRGYFMAASHVGHDCVVGDDVTFANSVALGGHCEIGDGVIFGGLSAVQQFCRVGKGAMIGGLTGVNRDVIPYAMAFGDHAELAGLNLIGLKRRGLSRDTINALRARLPHDFLWRRGRHQKPRRRNPRALPRNHGSWRSRGFHPCPRQAEALHRAPPWRRRRMTLGLIAGGGDLPRAVAQSVRADGRGVFVVALRGMCGDWVKEFPHDSVALGEPGHALKALKSAGAGDVLLAGRVERPKFSELKLDAKGDHDTAARHRGGAAGR